MNVDEALAQARDAMTVKRVFSEPYEKNGVTVIMAAGISGGAGAGGGEAPGGQGQGSGGGFGLNCRCPTPWHQAVTGPRKRIHPKGGFRGSPSSRSASRSLRTISRFGTRRPPCGRRSCSTRRRPACAGILWFLMLQLNGSPHASVGHLLLVSIGASCDS